MDEKTPEQIAAEKAEADKAAAAGTGTEPDLKAEVEKWKAMARKHEAEAKANSAAAAKLKETEEASKSDLQKAIDATTVADSKAKAAEAKAMRLEVAYAKGLTPAQAKRLVGETQEELEADADELLETFKPAEGENGQGGPKPPGNASEKLRVAGDSTATPDEMNPRKLAAAILGDK